MNNTVMLKHQNILDFSNAENLTNLLVELNDFLERNELKSPKIRIILGSLILNHAQICSIKTILESADVQIEVIYTSSVHTQLAVLSAGLAVSEQIPDFSLNADTYDNQSTQEICNNDGEHNYHEQIQEKTELVESSQTENAEPESIEKENTIDNSTEQTINKEPENTDNALEKEKKTYYIKHTLRSGQSVDVDGNVVIIGDSKAGSEVIASGDITIWGILSGIAHAGSKGDGNTSIRALKIDAIQLRIADLLARKPDKMTFEKVEKPTSYKPEEARISQGEIIIYPLNE